MNAHPPTDVTASDAGLLPKLRNRLRFGLATQELLDRCARAGVVAYPYYVVDEPVTCPAHPPGSDAALTIRELLSADIPQIATLRERPRDPARLRELMTRATCIGAFDGNELLAYSWFRSDSLRGVSGTRVMRDLPPTAAYLFDMYVCPRARGRTVAASLRREIFRRLQARGITHACSISLAFNRSTRRFKAKLGAKEVELRLLLCVKPFHGIDVRLRRSAWWLDTPAVHWSPARAEPS